METEEEREFRRSLDRQKHRETLRSLETGEERDLDESSPYAVAYKYMHEVQQEEQGSACAENRTPREARLYFKRGPDQRRYNEPTHDEVAAVFIGGRWCPTC